MKTKEKMKKIIENMEGITLVALVVTIVVLLILAGITIIMLFSENGIVKKAQDAAEATKNAQETTTEQLQNLTEELEEALGINSLKSIVETAVTVKASYDEAKANGTTIDTAKDVSNFFSMKEKIENSNYKDKLVSLEGNLVYLGNDETEKTEMESLGINTSLGSVINNIGKNNTQAMVYEDGYIRMYPTGTWKSEKTGYTEADFKNLIVNSDDETEQAKVTIKDKTDNVLSSFSLQTGLRIYYNNEYIGTLVLGGDADENGLVNPDDFVVLLSSKNFNKKVNEITTSSVATIKAMDINNDGIINNEDQDILTSNEYYNTRYTKN